MANRKLDKKTQEKMKIILDFLIVFNLLSIPMYLIIYSNLELSFLKNFEAGIVNKLLLLSGIKSEVFKNCIILSYNSHIYDISISWDSTGWKSLYAFFSLTIATPVYFCRKKIFLLLGTFTIFLANILRIWSTILISLKIGVSYFGIIHNFLWAEGMITLVLLLWIGWIHRQKNNIGEIKYIIR